MDSPFKFQEYALQVLKAFTAMVETQFQTTIKTFRTDNGLEFTNTETTNFFHTKGILHQKTCCYTSQQNGVVGWKHKHLLETARALLFQSKLPLKYWGERVLCATYIVNRLPSTVLKNKCPYEILYNKKPLYSDMRSLGCFCYATVPIPLRSEFEPRTTPYIFVGCPFETRGYKVLNFTTRSISVSRDVFPFNASVSSISPSSILHSILFIDFQDHTSIPSTHDSSTVVERPDVTCNLPSDSIAHSPSSVPSSKISYVDHIPETNHHAEPRRSTRRIQTPSHMFDYVHAIPNLKSHVHRSSHTSSPNTTSLRALFSNHHYLAHNALVPDSQDFVRNVCIDREPNSYEEAAIDPSWQLAMTQEFDSLHSNHTWDLVPLPHAMKAINCRWVYKIKHKADGSIERLKAKLVVKGYTQQAGIDYT